MGAEKRGVVPASEGGRRPTGDAGEKGRWSSGRKLQVVLRLLRGESLDAVSREVGVSAGRLAQWRDRVLAGGQAALKSPAASGEDQELLRLRAKVGALTMDNELLLERCHQLEAGLRPRRGRSRS